MSSLCRDILMGTMLLACLLLCRDTAAEGGWCCGMWFHDEEPAPRVQGKRVLRVAADPNNLPFSNRKLEGFENKIAQLVARELGAELQYVWRAQRRGFFRETLKSGDADLVMGAPKGFDRVLTTKPYYRSGYAFVSRKDCRLGVSSFDDPRLRTLRIGVQLVGDDGYNTPPAHAFASRGIVENLVGFTLYGDYAQDNPPARIIDAVAAGDVDVAVAWGPLAAYFAGKQAVPLEVTPVSPAEEPPLRFAFNIAMGVRRDNKALRDELDQVIERKREEIDRILSEYHVPLVKEEQHARQIR